MADKIEDSTPKYQAVIWLPLPTWKIIEIGDAQHILFQEGGDWPLWMTPQECVATKFSQYGEQYLKDNTKS